MKKPILITLMVLVLVVMSSVELQAWEADVKENPFDNERKVVIAGDSEDGEYIIGIRNLYEPIAILISVPEYIDPKEDLPEPPIEARYKFDDGEHQTAMFYPLEDGEDGFYGYVGIPEVYKEAKESNNTEPLIDLTRDFVQKMMEHDTLTIEIKYKERVDEYPVFDLQGLTDTITPYLEDFGME